MFFGRRKKQEAQRVLELAETMGNDSRGVDLIDEAVTLAPTAEEAAPVVEEPVIDRTPARKRKTPAKVAVTKKTTDNTKKPKAKGDWSKIKLGDIVRDKFNGALGVAMEKQWHLSGCIYLLVEFKDTPPSTEGVVDNIQRYELIESRPEFHRDDETMDGAHVKLGDEAKDTLSGFKGHVVGWSLSLYGAHRVAIDPGVKKDGTMGSMTFFDECRVEVITPKDPPKVAAAKRPAATNRGALPTTAGRSSMKRDTMAR